MSERAMQLSLVQKQEKDSRLGRSYRYEFWHVQGRDLDGKRIRKKFATREKALDWKSRKEIELINGKRAYATAYDIREALKSKRLVREYGGRWFVDHKSE